MASTSPDEIDRRMRALTKVLRKAGFKVTPQRMAIFREAARTDEHPDAETIFKRVRTRMPTVSLDTVYRTLGLLEKANLIWKVGTVRGRARFDANMAQHHHFVCSECGRIRDFQSRALDKLKVPREARSLGVVSSLRVQVRGICSACAARRRKKRRSRKG